MNLDEKWEIVRAYYESCYKDRRGNKIKFHARIEDSEIERLYKAMRQLPLDLEQMPNHRQKQFSNIIKLIRNSDSGDIN